MTPLARVSPLGKFRVELVGLAIGSGPRNTNPAWVEAVVVKLPVTADASAGTPPRPVTWNVRGPQGVERPGEAECPVRVSSRRAGPERNEEWRHRVVGHEVAGDVEDEVGRGAADSPRRWR